MSYATTPLYRLRAIVMGARSDGLVKANEEFAAWALGERSMPFGVNGEHVTIRLIDFDDIEKNSFVVTQQFTIRAGKTEKRADLVLLVNGIPLVLIEAKTPVRSSQSWLDAAIQVHDDYEKNVPELFVPNVFSVATEGKEFRYGSIRMPVDLWGPWRDGDGKQSLGEMEKAAASMLRPAMVLDMLDSFTAPIFLLVPQVKLPKRLDLARDADRALDGVPGLIVANWVETRF